MKIIFTLILARREHGLAARERVNFGPKGIIMNKKDYEALVSAITNNETKLALRLITAALAPKAAPKKAAKK